MRHSFDGSNNRFSKFNQLLRSSHFAFTCRASLLAVAVVPLYGFSDNHSSSYDRMMNTKTLTVAAVPGTSTFFKEDEFLHGFGYDLARAYASNMNVKLEFKSVRSEKAALDMVKNGQADFALTTADSAKIEAKALTALDVSCGTQNTLQKYGLSEKLSWTFKDADDRQAATANGFLCGMKQQGTLAKLAAFYDRTVIDEYSQKVFTQDITTRLPIYKASFQKNAKKHDLDWHLLAAISYQESHLKPSSVSPTGVTGLMMLTQSTARAMGVSDRRDPAQSIQGGAQYFRLMLSQYEDVPNPDQIWFALAAYNMGPGAVDRVRNIVKRSGKNPDSWVNVYQYMSTHAKSNGSFRQCLTYVTHIRAYLEGIKQDESLATI